jgi:hypothetical protein
VPLAAGSRLGPYEILSALGAGGMGEVYRARDTKLGRDVALKVLPEAFATDSDRLARFKREAQVLASLDHPNIGAIYGFEESDDMHALVLQLVEGPTLADRITQGPILLDDALPIARQIAEALEAAHEKGVIHRDLKPANIKLTPHGQVKVLDFGLAKLLDSDTVASSQARGFSPGLTNSPTITTPAMTMAGVILGTAAYMSPEQARGRTVDKRADIWAFGTVLFETITGRQAFEGELVSDVLASVLKTEPDWQAVPTETPAALRRLLRRCLEKDPRRRLQAIGEARVQIEDLIGGATTESDAASAGAVPLAPVRLPMRRRAIPIAATAIVAAVLTGLIGAMLSPRRAPPTVTRFTFTLPEGQRFVTVNRRNVDISPDGTDLVYAANNRLYLRRMSDLQSTILTGSDSDFNYAPVFSPDGRWIASSGTTARSRRFLVPEARR